MQRSFSKLFSFLQFISLANYWSQLKDDRNNRLIEKKQNSIMSENLISRFSYLITTVRIPLH